MGRIHYHHGITLFSYIFAVADNGAFPLCESEKNLWMGEKKQHKGIYRQFTLCICTYECMQK